MARATWKPHTRHGELTERSDSPDSVFAIPEKRKLPLTDADHSRNALARFDQMDTFQTSTGIWLSLKS